MDADEVKAMLDKLERDAKLLEDAGKTKEAERRRREIETLRRRFERGDGRE
ncbi:MULTISPECIES: hypothetical protein [Burkholderia]|uniref:hypothetical protein n=1 Tax=Burkholderia TaxID=32008 RepID=UPI00052A1A58|nr:MULTISPECIES: hypothetical protein [Burkholderia]AIV49259.1 hypothetical protein X988_2249 [Burkholderia pseudomallei TSV 48]